MRRIAIAAVVALVAAAISGCDADQAAPPDSANSSAAAGFPVTIQSALGAVTIDAAPQRVVTIGWGSQDAALALGVVPVGMQDFSADSGSADGVLPWDRDKLAGATPAKLKASTSEIPYEQIAALRPDVILAVYSGVEPEQYSRLSGIAPTVGYPDKPWSTSWQDQVKLVGQALARSQQAATLTRQTTERIAMAAKEHPEFAGKTIAFGSGTEPGSFNFYYDDDPRSELLEQLGFTLSADVSRLGSGGSTSSFAKKVSMELL